jgi:hypothetical protein
MILIIGDILFAIEFISPNWVSPHKNRVVCDASHRDLKTLREKNAST